MRKTLENMGGQRALKHDKLKGDFHEVKQQLTELSDGELYQALEKRLSAETIANMLNTDWTDAQRVFNAIPEDKLKEVRANLVPEILERLEK